MQVEKDLVFDKVAKCVSPVKRHLGRDLDEKGEEVMCTFGGGTFQAEEEILNLEEGVGCLSNSINGGQCAWSRVSEAGDSGSYVGTDHGRPCGPNKFQNLSSSVMKSY